MTSISAALNKAINSIMKGGRFLAAAYERANAHVAPFDVRCLLILLCFPLAYKIVSLDFTALGDLCARDPLSPFRPSWLASLFSSQRCLLFAGERTKIITVVAAALLVATVVRPSRLLLVPAVILVWIIDTGAAQFRYTLYTIDTPLALLTLLCLAPVNLARAAAWDVRPAGSSQVAMSICFFYVASFYVQAGLSKFVFDWNWAGVVKTGNYYPLSWIWHSQELPDVIEPIARHSSAVLRAHPWLDVAAAHVVLIEQFIWLLAPFSLMARVHAGLFAALYHALVIVMTGITFITWIPAALGVTLPFSRILIAARGGSTTVVPEHSGQPVFRRTIYAFAVASLAAWLPAGGLPFPPFHNYLQFGWRYLALDEVKSFYRVGFRNPRDGSAQVIGLGQGAFLDFRHTSGLDSWARVLVEHRDHEYLQRMARQNIESLLLASRAPESNGWLLGRWRSPDHLIGKAGPVAAIDVREFLVLKGFPVPGQDDRPAGARFLVCASIDYDRALKRATFDIHEECREP